jgi:hypothetical protein
MANEFVVSVANFIARDPTTGNALAYGKTNISSAFGITMQNTDVRGGILNPLLYSYYHTREVTINLEQATFGETILALNAGATVSTGAVNVLQTDCLTLSSSGSGTISLTPVGNVSVILPSGTISTVTPTVKTITVTGGENAVVTAIYVTSKSADQITISTTTPPSIIDLTLIAEIRSASQSTVLKYLQINIPQFQVSGNYTLNLAANGVSTESLEGKALATFASDCTTGDYFAKVTFIPTTTNGALYSSIDVDPSYTEWAKSSVQSQQLTVYGYGGGVYGRSIITGDCTFARSGSSGSGITVGSGGLISTSASGVTIPSLIIISASYAAGSMVAYAGINVV